MEDQVDGAHRPAVDASQTITSEMIERTPFPGKHYVDVRAWEQACQLNNAAHNAFGHFSENIHTRWGKAP